MSSGFVGFLRRIGGGTNKELDAPQVSQSTRNHYTVLGALMLIVATMSATVAGFTWASVMHTAYVGVGVAMAWFCFSLALNYMMAQIIGSVRGHKGALATIVATILLFGALVSAVNTNFVMLFMMDTEIHQTLQANYQAERGAKERQLANLQTSYAEDLGALRLKAATAEEKVRSAGSTQIGQLKVERDRLLADYQAATAAVAAEADGHAVSRQVGVGPRTKLKQERERTAKALYDDAEQRIKDAEAKLDPAIVGRLGEIAQTRESEERRLAERLREEKSQVQRNIDELDNVPRDGFVNRDLALWQQLQTDPHLMFLFVSIFFLIECIVGLVKLLKGKTDYDVLLEANSLEHINAAGERIKSGKEAIRTRQRDDALAELEHRRALRNARLTDDAEELAALSQRHLNLEAHFKALEAGGMPEEAVDKLRAAALKKSGVERLKLVVNR